MTILGMNAAAEAILARPACALSARRGRLSASNPPRSGVLEQTMAQVCTLIEGVMPSPGGDLIVSVPEGGSDLLQSIGPLMHAPVYGLPATRVDSRSTSSRCSRWHRRRPRSWRGWPRPAAEGYRGARKISRSAPCASTCTTSSARPTPSSRVTWCRCSRACSQSSTAICAEPDTDIGA